MKENTKRNCQTKTSEKPIKMLNLNNKSSFSLHYYYMAGSASGQDEANPLF